MSDNIKVSVIIPVYNAEKYLEKNLLVLVKQTLNEIEFICVNDNSTDKSLDILLAFKQVFPDKFVIINLERNRGAGGARNVGIKHARGEYIGFVDADDAINTRMYEEMYDNAVANNSDITVCGFYNEDCKEDGSLYSINGEIYGEEKLYFILSASFYIWNKIYKKELINSMSMHFRENVKYQDTDFWMEAAFRAKSVSTVEKIFYYYRRTDGSATKSLKYSVSAVMGAVSELMEYVDKRCGDFVAENIMDFFKREIVIIHLKTMFSYNFINPNLTFKDFKPVYDFAQKYYPGFYNNKIDDAKIFDDIVWNVLCEGAEECYNALRKLRREMESGEFDEKMRLENNSENNEKTSENCE